MQEAESAERSGRGVLVNDEPEPCQRAANAQEPLSLPRHPQARQIFFLATHPLLLPLVAARISCSCHRSPKPSLPATPVTRDLNEAMALPKRIVKETERLMAEP